MDEEEETNSHCGDCEAGWEHEDEGSHGVWQTSKPIGGLPGSDGGAPHRGQKFSSAPSDGSGGGRWGEREHQECYTNGSRGDRLSSSRTGGSDEEEWDDSNAPRGTSGRNWQTNAHEWQGGGLKKNRHVTWVDDIEEVRGGGGGEWKKGRQQQMGDEEDDDELQSDVTALCDKRGGGGCDVEELYYDDFEDNGVEGYDDQCCGPPEDSAMDEVMPCEADDSGVCESPFLRECAALDPCGTMDRGNARVRHGAMVVVVVDMEMAMSMKEPAVDNYL